MPQIPQGDRPQSRGVAACQLAREYLLAFREAGVTEGILSHYLEPSLRPPPTINGVYRRLLESAQNANMRARVVGGAIGGVGKLEKVLCGFDPTTVRCSFKGGWEEVLDAIEAELTPRGKIRRTPRSIWPLFCRAILTGASFLSQFANASEFYAFVDIFDRDDRLRPALPMLLSHEIDGFGFPLACDFLKEMGYLNFGKPDVHVKAILSGLGLTPPRATDYQVFKAILLIAREAGTSPYHVDKLFWLVGSGYFYDHHDIGQGGRIRTNRSAFIAEARRRLDDGGSSLTTACS